MQPDFQACRPIRILVVDDDPAIVEMLCIMLTEAGISPASASNASEGLEMLKAETWDALLTDREMPEVNGDELAKAVKCLFPKMRIVMVTGWPPSREECSRLGLPLDAIVTKPFTFQSLLGALQDAPPPPMQGPLPAEFSADREVEHGQSEPRLHAQRPPAPDKGLTQSLKSDFQELSEDLERARELFADAHAQLLSKSRESEALRALLEKSTQDLGQLRIDIDALRKERHFFANEAMRAAALEVRIADVTVERERLRAGLLRGASSRDDDLYGAACLVPEE